MHDIAIFYLFAGEWEFRFLDHTNKADTKLIQKKYISKRGSELRKRLHFVKFHCSDLNQVQIWKNVTEGRTQETAILDLNEEFWLDDWDWPVYCRTDLWNNHKPGTYLIVAVALWPELRFVVGDAGLLHVCFIEAPIYVSKIVKRCSPCDKHQKNYKRNASVLRCGNHLWRRGI